jgi:hypothetical protein
MEANLPRFLTFCNKLSALRAFAVRLGLNVGKAAWRPCAAHPRGTATNLSPARTSVSPEAYDEAAVFSWMGGRAWP